MRGKTKEKREDKASKDMNGGNEIKRYKEWMNDKKRRKNEMKEKGKREGRRKGQH